MPTAVLPAIGGAPDTALIAAARGGDLHAWETVVRRHQGFAFRCAYLTTRDPETAEEAVKLAFIRAYRSLSSLEAGAEFRSWLMRIVTGVSRAKTRETARHRDAKFVDPQHSPRLPAERFAPAVAHGAPTPLEHEALVAAFDRLGNEDREIVASRYALGLSRSEIVAYLGISEQDVDDRLRVAVRRLRTYLDGA